MFIKIHRSYRNIVALCDAELLGKRFEEGMRQLYLRESFYKDKKITHDEAVRILQQQAQEDATFNIAGKKAIQAALDAGIITRKYTTHIAGVPLALVF